MAFTELEIARIVKATDAYTDQYGPPVRVRDKLSWDWDIDRQSVILYEVRPHWKNASEIIRSGCIKVTFIRTRNIWRIYWMRQDLKWHSYEAHAEVKSFENVLKVLENDEYGCFFG